MDFSCGFFGADFLVRIFGCGFFARILGCGFFRGFCDGLCGFWVRIFSADFLGCFPAEKALKKSHQKIPPKNPHQRSSPRSVSSQYATTFLLAKHSRSPQSVWMQMHLVENRFLCADGVCRGGWACNLNMCLVLMSRMTRRQNGPVILQEFFLMGRAICALTGRDARHENTKKYFSRQHLPKKILSGRFCYQQCCKHFIRGLAPRRSSEEGPRWPWDDPC